MYWTRCPETGCTGQGVLRQGVLDKVSRVRVYGTGCPETGCTGQGVLRQDVYGTRRSWERVSRDIFFMGQGNCRTGCFLDVLYTYMWCTLYTVVRTGTYSEHLIKIITKSSLY